MGYKNAKLYKKSTKSDRKSKKSSKKSSSDLNSTEVKTVEEIVEKKMNAKMESKYFNSAIMNDPGFKRASPFHGRVGNPNFSVLGYAVGTGDLGGAAQSIYYGVDGTATQHVYSMDCLKLHAPATAAGANEPLLMTPLAQNALEGSVAYPSTCKSTWQIIYPQQRVGNDNRRRGSPVYCRMIRVRPRMGKYSDVAIVPRSDLFVDQNNLEIGINAAGMNDQEIMMFNVNKRKYQVIQDVTRVLVPTATYYDTQVADGVDVVSNLEKSSNVWNFELNHEQPKKVFYNTQSSYQPKSGQSNELIFFHFFNIGLEGSNEVRGDEVQVTCKVISTFKDA